MTEQSRAHPYAELPENAFWRLAVADKPPAAIRKLWNPRFVVQPQHKILTAGSCFAQHIGRELSARNWGWVDAEQAPRSLNEDIRRRFGYDIFSFRTGNIYTTRLLHQWLAWSLDRSLIDEEVWESDGRYYDPVRPTIEPNGFADREELSAARTHTLDIIKSTIKTADVFVFTLGLTESWRNRKSGLEYQLCPGTSAGQFDPELHEFVNCGYVEVRQNLEAAIAIMRQLNPQIRVLLTVSPVPLVATKSGEHVLVATTYSKSVLRAVAGECRASNDFVDYFPSYEIITGIPFRSIFFELNMRNVSHDGVSFVMQQFFEAFPAAASAEPALERSDGQTPQSDSTAQPTSTEAPDPQAVICEEELLEAMRA
jgi:hypothetical protein